MLAIAKDICQWTSPYMFAILYTMNYNPYILVPSVVKVKVSIKIKMVASFFSSRAKTRSVFCALAKLTG